MGDVVVKGIKGMEDALVEFVMKGTISFRNLANSIISDMVRIAIQQTLNGMGFSSVNEVRQGKFFEVDVNEKDEAKAKIKVEDMCKKLLANLVIENFEIL